MDKFKKLLGVFIFIAALFLCACHASNTAAPPPTDEGEANNTPESIVSQPIDKNSSNIAPESPFKPLMDGDTSLLCPSEDFDADDLEHLSSEFSKFRSGFIFEETDIDGDGENELIVKEADENEVLARFSDKKNAVVGVFNKSEKGIECWLWDTVEQTCVWALEDDGVFCEIYYYNGSVSESRIYFNADGQAGVVVDIGKDAPRCVVYSSCLPTPNPGEGSYMTLTVYTMDDSQTPLQSMSVETYVSGIYIDDLNFDGYMDFYYEKAISVTGNYYCNAFLWDAEQGVFCENYELGNICKLDLDADNEVVVEMVRNSAGSGEKNYYKYIDGKLTCIRKVAHDFYYDPFLSVEDYIDGELVTVFYDKQPRERFDYSSEDSFDWPDGKYEEFKKWYDINYHGE